MFFSVSNFEDSRLIMMFRRLSLMEAMLGLLCSIMMLSLLHNVWILLSIVGHVLLTILVIVVALWWRVAGVMFLLVCGVLTCFGCAGRPDRSESSQRIETVQRSDEVLRAMRAESSALRSDMAATRIAAAKKEAELQDLRRQLAGLRQTVETKQGELLALREERDHLLQTKSDFQIQLAEVPQLRQTAMDARASETALQKRLKDFETSLTTLLEDIAQVKKELAEVKAASHVQKTTVASSKRAAAPSQPLLLPSGEKIGMKGNRPSH